MKPKINYLLATWSGGRSRKYFDDSYLSRHIHHLNKVKHQLAQVSIGYPHNPTERKPYTDFIRSLKKLNDGTPIVIYPVDNNGRSYGQWSHIFNATRDQFTHYICIEDDYAPCFDYFDQKLVEIYEELAPQNCGYLCGLVFFKEGRFGTGKWPKNFAAVSNGIASNEVLNRVWTHFGCLPHDHVGYSNGQIKFSSAFEDVGYHLFDYLPQYRCLYYQHDSTIRVYWDGVHDQDIISPIQYLDKMMEFDLQDQKIFEPKPAVAAPVPEPELKTKTAISELRAKRAAIAAGLTKGKPNSARLRSFQLSNRPVKVIRGHKTR